MDKSTSAAGWLGRLAERKPAGRTHPRLRRLSSNLWIQMKSLIVILILSLLLAVTVQTQNRPRARELGINVGILPTGTLNAITDVPGVLVGHTTVIRGDNVRTGVTAILPHGGNLFQEKVPGAVFVGNGFGKLAGSTQINELGEIETPVL